MAQAVTIDRARAAKARALELFSPAAEVVGVGITQVQDGYGLKVNLRTEPAPGVQLPQEVDGVPIRIEVVGVIRKRQ